MRSLYLTTLLTSWLSSMTHCMPPALPFHLSKNLTGPDLSPLICHIPNTHDTLLIRVHNYPLPFIAFASTIREARHYIAGVLATTSFRPDSRLPPEQDPSEFPRSDMLSQVSITWQSKEYSELTWGILAAAMKGLEDCLVINDQLPWVVSWHVFDGAQRGEVGYGVIGRGKIRSADVTDS